VEGVWGVDGVYLNKDVTLIQLLRSNRQLGFLVSQFSFLVLQLLNIAVAAAYKDIDAG